MDLLIRNAMLLGEDGEELPGRHDIEIEAGTISTITEFDRSQSHRDVRVIDAEGGLVIPGLFNAHAHTSQLFLRGLSWGLPLEPYILLNATRDKARIGLTPDDIYYRTLAACGEMLRNGITGVADDVAHPSLRREDIDAVFQAYCDAGMRARVSIAVQDLSWRCSLPYESTSLTGSEDLLDSTQYSISEALAAYEYVLGRWEQESSLARPMISPSAPHRSSRELLGRLVELARSAGVPVHLHVQESPVQFMQGPAAFNGRSMIRYLFDEGLLGQETAIAHGVWLTDGDIACIAEADSTVVHNPASNLKLGSGVARVRDLISAGVNVAIGCDGYTCNDAMDMIEATKLASIVSSIADFDSANWLSPAEVLNMATVGGAFANRLPYTGTVSVGGPADVLVLDASSPSFIPLNDPVAQFVFCAKPRDVKHVVVNGQQVVQDGRCTSVDLNEVLTRVQGASERFWTQAEPSIEANRKLMPGVMRGYRTQIEQLQKQPLQRTVTPPPAS